MSHHFQKYKNKERDSYVKERESKYEMKNNIYRDERRDERGDSRRESREDNVRNDNGISRYEKEGYFNSKYNPQHQHRYPNRSDREERVERKKDNYRQRSRSNSISRKNGKSKYYRSISRSNSSSSSSSSSSYKAIKRSPRNKNLTKNYNDKQSLTIIPQQIGSVFNYNFNPTTAPIQDSIIPKHKELSNTLIISDLGPDINISILEDVLREKCLELQTSMPDDIKFLESIRVAYIIFPSIPASTRIYEALSGNISINGNYYPLDFTPNLTREQFQPHSNKTSMTYITSVSDNSAFTTSMETTVHEDWICEFCDCKNFSKRIACFKCKRTKTLNCRIIPVIKQKTTVMGEGGQIPPCTSLLIRGSIIRNTDETELLEVFSQYGQVKDIRMITEKVTGEPKDFAFVEFFTIEEASFALNAIKRNPVKVRGNLLFVTFSKIKKPEDIKDYGDACKKEPYDYGNISLVNEGPQQLQVGTFNNSVLSETSHGLNSSSNVLNSIKISNLTSVDQTKLMNISHLQNMIQQSQNSVIVFNPKDNKGESNLRREKELTEREKVELEMKKWKKKIEKQKNEDTSNNLKNLVMNYEFNNTLENEYEDVISIDTKKDVLPSQLISEKFTPITIGEGFPCNICQRKFPTEDKLEMHENLSSLHKENLNKLNI